MENKVWQKTVGSLIGAIWLYTLADIAGSITEFIDGLLNPIGFLDMISALTGGSEDSSPFSVFDLLGYLFPLLVFMGYLLFFSSLSRFALLQRSDADRMAVRKVRKAYILMFVAILVGFIPIIGKLAALIITIVAYASMLSGYKSLRDSDTFPEEARRGAARLRAATIWLLVGYIIGCLPLCGIIESLISFIAFFSILSGWNRIRQGAPELTEEELSTLIQENPHMMVSKSVIPIWFIPAFVGLFLVYFLCILSLDLFGFFTNPKESIWNQQLFEEITINQVFSWMFMGNTALLIIGFAFLFISKKVYLNAISKVGIVLYILPFIINFFSLQLYISMSNQVYNILFLILGLLSLVGMILLVCNVVTDRATRIAVIVFMVLGEVGVHVIPYLVHTLYPMEPMYSFMNIREIWLRSFYLLNSLVCFVIVLTKAIQRSRIKEEPVLPA